MRTKKNREVNIFSASVVDLFASGLGVFLIVSIIALVNQKKESEKQKVDKPFDKVGEVSEDKTKKLMLKVEELEKEIFNLKVKRLEEGSGQDSTKQIEEIKSNFESEKMDLLKLVENLEKKNKKSLAELTKTQDIVSELKDDVKKGEEGVSNKFSDFEIGTKIRLENVQFYPGTDRPIEPYASKEIQDFAHFMNANPRVIVEVSGHIFETKKAILSGRADDKYNLSGARARKVCEILGNSGVSDKRLNCIGYGAERYIHLTDDQYSLEAQKNRRVEIEILSK